MQEAADPVLVDAVLDVKRASVSYKATDEERLLGLQASYITLNPHPVREKDKLDAATGPKEYHAIHLKYHPKYRTILMIAITMISSYLMSRATSYTPCTRSSTGLQTPLRMELVNGKTLDSVKHSKQQWQIQILSM